MRSSTCRFAALLTFAGATALPAQQRTARVAIVLDQQSPRFASQIEAFRREILSFFPRGEIQLLPDRAGDGTIAGLNAVLQSALRDSSVSVVVALGTISSHLLARAGSPAKPAIAAGVIDAAWQDLPQKDGASGVARLTYVDESYPVGITVAQFHRMIPFKKLAVLMDRDLLGAIPALQTRVPELVRGAGGEGIVVPSGKSADEILAAIPAEADAVYLTPMPALSDAEYTRLIAGVNARRLPTLSYLAVPDVKLGALASYEPAENLQRRARRIAVDLQRIIAGEDAGKLPVRLVSSPRLTLNLATARSIGFAPGWSIVTDAELIGADSAGPADTLGLSDMMRRAMDANLDVAAAELEVTSGQQNVRLARANLLPQLASKFTQTFTRKETAEASFGQQPERKLDGGLSFSLPLYNEQSWAGYGSQQSIQRQREAGRDQKKLDIALDAGTAYLNVLRAETQLEVQRTNLSRTRTNLEVARLREGVGSSSRADVYRWEGEVANARRSVIDAESQVRKASLEVSRLLNKPLGTAIARQPVSLGQPALLALDSCALAVFDQPARFQALTTFLMGQAESRSPELAQLDAGLAAERRQRSAADRSFWLPAFSLEGGVTNTISRGGAGSTTPDVPAEFSGLFPKQQDLSWQFKLQGSLPLFTGFSRGAQRAQAGIEIDKLTVQRESVRQSIYERVRASLLTAASSYAAIGLTRDAALAAERNYALVTDAYANGSANITTLLDAQTQALNSAEAAANAVHDFLLDLLTVERSIGRFGALESKAEQDSFQQRLEAALRSGESTP